MLTILTLTFEQSSQENLSILGSYSSWDQIPGLLSRPIGVSGRPILPSKDEIQTDIDSRSRRFSVDVELSNQGNQQGSNLSTEENSSSSYVVLAAVNIPSSVDIVPKQSRMERSQLPPSGMKEKPFNAGLRGNDVLPVKDSCDDNEGSMDTSGFTGIASLQPSKKLRVDLAL